MTSLTRTVGKTMRALTFVRPGELKVVTKPIPEPGVGQALIKVTTTTICGTDVHIMKGEYAVKSGLTIGHEAIGRVVELGPGSVDEVEGESAIKEGDRVLVGAITPCGQCYSCLSGVQSQCGGHPMGGWKFGNTHDGAQAEYFLVHDARANLTKIPDHLTDEQVICCADVMSTGIGGAENGDIKIGDTVVIFAQGPVGLCATAGAKLRGATTIIGVDSVDTRLDIAKKLGATHVINFTKEDPLARIRMITDGRMADVAIEALGTQETFTSCLKALRPGGTLSSLGVYSGKLSVPLDAMSYGLGDNKIVTTLCPGGKERMRRMLNLISSGAVDMKPMITHRFAFDEILEAYDLFANHRDGVLKVAVHMPADIGKS